MIHSTRALAALFAATMLSAGCGGGGDGGSSSNAATAPAPAPVSTVPLALSANNAASVAGLAPAAGEAILTIAQFAADSARSFAAPGTPSPSITACPNGGLLTITLTDRDGNGIASAGDRITVDARDCGVSVITDIVTGTMQIELSPPTGLPAGGLRAAVALGDGLRFGSSAASPDSLLGSFQFDWSSTVVQTVLHVTPSAADDLRVAGGSGNAAFSDSIRQPDLTKTLQYDEARALSSFSYRYESLALGGSVTVTTPVPLRAYLNTYPEIGRIEVTGAASGKVVLTPNFANDSGQFQVALDSNGDGTPEATGSLAWTSSVLGYLWWDGTTPLPWSMTGSYGTRAFATTDFSASAHLNWVTSSTSSVRLQFSRPPARTTPALHYRFVDTGSSINDSAPLANIAASGEVHGALVIVRPNSPLRHARHYSLEVSLDGLNWYDGVTVQDALGNSTSTWQWTGRSFTTPDNLRALAVAQSGALLASSDALSLNGQTSTGTPRPIVSYRWSQVSGTPLRFSDAAAAQTTVSWGATPPSGIEQAVVRLTIADAMGDTDAIELTILSADLSNSNRVLYFRSAPGEYIGKGTTQVFDTGVAQFQDSLNAGYLRASAVGPNWAYWWYLDLATSNGAPLQVGAYENAIRAAFRGTQNGIDFSGSASGCSQTVGRFDVLEIQTDPSGAITRLAVDFEQHCEFASAPALFGSYRVNSSVPIRR